MSLASWPVATRYPRDLEIGPTRSLLSKIKIMKSVFIRRKDFYFSCHVIYSSNHLLPQDILQLLLLPSNNVIGTDFRDGSELRSERKWEILFHAYAKWMGHEIIHKKSENNRSWCNRFRGRYRIVICGGFGRMAWWEREPGLVGRWWSYPCLPWFRSFYATSMDWWQVCSQRYWCQRSRWVFNDIFWWQIIFWWH